MEKSSRSSVAVKRSKEKRSHNFDEGRWKFKLKSKPERTKSAVGSVKDVVRSHMILGLIRHGIIERNSRDDCG